MEAESAENLPAEPPFTVEEVNLDVVLPLRSAILRDGGPAELPGDDDPDTLHLAVRDGQGGVVGVVRLSPARCPWRADAAAPWQLRGMATDLSVRGSGIGRALVDASLAAVAERGGDLVWCDARVGAAGFYRGMGFARVTEPYDKPGIGPHVGMVLERSPLTGSRARSTQASERA